MKRIIYISFIVLTIVLSWSCEAIYDWNEPKEPSTEYSSAYPLAGEWYVTYKFDDGSGVIDDYYGVGYVRLWTTNTAANDGKEMWISDGGNTGYGDASFWGYSVKTPINTAAKTFSGTDLESSVDDAGVPYEVVINIENGKVIVDGGLSTSGVVVDSIYFEIEFSDDPGTIYHCSGTRRTGFPEDDH